MSPIPQFAALLPRAVDWAEACAADIARRGRALDDVEAAQAKAVGVQQVDLVRLAELPALPVPDDPELRRACMVIGLLGDDTVGLTLGHSIMVRDGHLTRRLLSHELRHVHQYEQSGSIAAFLPLYLGQLVDFGYLEAPLEIDARRHEQPG